MPGETETTLRDKLGSSAGTSAWTSGGGSSNYNHGTGQNSQNQNQNQDVKPKKEHKLLTALKELQAAGKGNTEQAKVLKGYLSGVVSPHDQPGGPPGQKDTRSFYDKKTLLDDYYAGIKPAYNKYGLPTAVLDQMKGHPLYKAGMSMTPTSNMLFGYGSPFGASTGTTASSPVVQDALLNMMGQYYNKYDYSTEDAIKAAMANFYPQVPMYDFDGPPGTTVMGSPNYMGNKTAAELVASGHQYVEDIFKQNPTAGYGFGGGGGYGGGWGSGWGSGGGGGGSGDGSGFGLQTHDPMQQGYQRGQVGPGTLQEQVNQIYLGMSNLNAAPGFNKNRGGIVSLVQ